MKYKPLFSMAVGLMFPQVILLFVTPTLSTHIWIAVAYLALVVVWGVNLKIGYKPPDDTAYKLRLDQPAFRHLVRGGVVKAGPVEVIFADIGYDAMADEVNEARWQEKT